MAENMSAVSAVIHVTNVSPHTKPEQLRALFEFLGPIKRCELRGEYVRGSGIEEGAE
jgi:hypothetical protein